MNMGVAKSRRGVKLAGAAGTGGRSFQMNSLNDEPKGEAITVVLVEDDAPTLWRLQDALTKAGYQVRAAGTLAEARACLAQGAPKVLLTDLQLPAGHGVDLIRETRRRHRLSAQGRLPDRYRRHRARSRRRALADLGLDRALHRAADPELARAAARPRAQHRQADAARDRHPLGHRQGVQLRRDRQPSRSVAPDRAWAYQEHLSQARGSYPGRSSVRGGSARLDQVVNDHDEDATAEQLSGHERRRLQTSRLVQYLLLQAVIVAACIFALRQSLPGPPTQYQVTAFKLSEAGSERAVTLPYFSPLRNAMNDPPRFTGQFVRPAGEASQAWSVYLPRFTNGVEVTVNDVVILDSRRDPAANRPDRNTPQIAVIPASVLHDGENTISIRLFIWGPISGFLDRIWVGPDQLLRPSYDLRTLVFVTLPVVFSSWQAILAVILGIMWVMRRHEPAYGVLAAAMAVGVGQAFLQTPMDETPFSRLNVILISSAPIESALVLTFALS